MARIDDYNQALELAINELKDKDPKLIAAASGADFETDVAGQSILDLEFLNRKVFITWPDFRFSFKDSQDEISIQQQILLLHYLNGAKGDQTTGDWIAYQEAPDGRFYLDAFLRRAKNPMVQTFGDRPEDLVELTRKIYGAVPFDHGDLSVVVQALPWISVALILWRGDDEFPPEGNLLFDRSISKILSAEDIAWLAGMIIYPIMGMVGK